MTMATTDHMTGASPEHLDQGAGGRSAQARVQSVPLQALTAAEYTTLTILRERGGWVDHRDLLWMLLNERSITAAPNTMPDLFAKKLVQRAGLAYRLSPLGRDVLERLA